MPHPELSVPIVSEDLREEESLLQMFDALEGLDVLATTVFNKISQRVLDDRDRIFQLNKRINVAQAKVSKLIGSRQATSIFSSAKYPVQSLSSFECLYPRHDDQDQIKFHHVHSSAEFAKKESVLGTNLIHVSDPMVRKRDIGVVSEKTEKLEGLG
eukprot:m.124447 g.124447  ORF g.124447 m.124447 type:complete len:156 (+) comp52181_c0_seq1:39-506(+)